MIDIYVKSQAKIAVQAQHFCNLMNASCQQKDASQVIFHTHGHRRTKLFQTLGGRGITLAPLVLGITKTDQAKTVCNQSIH